MQQLVAVACAHRHALAALGATARQDGGSALGLHAAAEAMGLRAAAAIRLKCALRHGSALLKKLFKKLAPSISVQQDVLQQFLSISHYSRNRKIRGDDPVFHNPWCNPRRDTQFASKVRFKRGLNVLVSAPFTRDFSARLAVQQIAP